MEEIISISKKNYNKNEQKQIAEQKPVINER